MKKIKSLLIAIIAVVLVPFTVNAAKNEPITVHMFRGEGCGYCAAALEFFESIESEYGKYFDLETHEVWYDEDNANFMQDVAAYFGEDVGGVPYIIIGDKTFQGYAEQYDEEIIDAITTAYESGSFVDRVAQVQNGEVSVGQGSNSKEDAKEDKEDKSNKTTIIIIIVALVGFIAMVYFARDTEDEIELDEEVVEEIKNDEVKEEVVEEEKKTPVKKTTAKKTNTAKKTPAKKTTKKTPAKKTTKKTTKK